jgi:hypothetical protein
MKMEHLKWMQICTEHLMNVCVLSGDQLLGFVIIGEIIRLLGVLFLEIVKK